MPFLRTFFSADHALHDPPMEFLHGQNVPYFEQPSRMESIRSALAQAGISHEETPPPTLPREQIARAHDPHMIAYLEALSSNVTDEIRAELAIYDMQARATADLYYYESVFPPRAQGTMPESARRFFIYDSTSPVGAGTWQAVYSSANVAHHSALALLQGEQTVYALCRPPGHHAGRDFMGGYCYFNNAALAAYTLLERGKVAVLDIDYHHGNGTQAILWDEPRIFFASIHADPLVDYPYYCGYAGETGGQHAPDTNLNLPLPHGTAEAAYLAALDRALGAISAFAPQTLVVSLGFDTFKDDPIAKFRLEVSSYTVLGRAIASLNVPTVYVQEGGYAVGQLGAMAVAFFEGVMG